MTPDTCRLPSTRLKWSVLFFARLDCLIERSKLAMSSQLRYSLAALAVILTPVTHIVCPASPLYIFNSDQRQNTCVQAQKQALAERRKAQEAAVAHPNGIMKSLKDTASQGAVSPTGFQVDFRDRNLAYGPNLLCTCTKMTKGLSDVSKEVLLSPAISAASI